MGKEFVGNASHELRTPITIIKGFTEMLLESDEIEPAMQKSILKKMAASCERMEHLVKHLLRLTDLENTTLEALAPVDIHRLIEDISYQVISIYPDVRIEHLRKEEDVRAYIDSDLIELVFTNLFKNAVKYSKEEKVIQVKVDTSGEDIYIQVKDRGIGIPQKDLEKIFDRFYTVDKAHCRKLGGAGLGLSIVRLIVGKHGGKIYATSVEGESTTMHLHLPKAKDPYHPSLR
jgi:two-component system phosphate regulon sensor histidine kinase PhoR